MSLLFALFFMVLLPLVTAWVGPNEAALPDASSLLPAKQGTTPRHVVLPQLPNYLLLSTKAATSSSSEKLPKTAAMVAGSSVLAVSMIGGLVKWGSSSSKPPAVYPTISVAEPKNGLLQREQLVVPTEHTEMWS